MPIESWEEIFMPGIRKDEEEDVNIKRTFLVSPIDGSLTYKRLGAKEMKADDSEAKQAIDFRLNTVQTQISEPQVRDLRLLLDYVAAARIRQKNVDIRPHR